MKPLFMWAGGKTRMLKHYLPYIPLTVKTYVEPFFGGGAMFLWIIKNRYPERFVINDINPDIVNIYQSIKTDYDEFMDHLRQLDRTYIPMDKATRKDYYFKVRHEHAYDYVNWSKAQEAATLYFLMKTGFNGIFQINKNTNGRFGTPSGLLNQTDCVYDSDVVDFWHKTLQSVDIKCGDWSAAIPAEQTEDMFVFLDPPYRGSFTSYGQDFGDDKQEQVVEFAKNTVANVFICNRDIGDDFFTTRMGDLELKYFDTTYTAGRRKKVQDGFEAKKAVEILLYRSRNIL